MNQVEVISKLKAKASSDPAANAVFHVWALRQRARFQVTVGALELKMKAEGFKFSRKEYSRLLSDLGSMGLGKIERNKRGEVEALKEVKTTLQSIGQAAVGQRMELATFKQRNKFDALAVKTENLAAVASQVQTLQFPVSLTVLVNGKPVNFRIPANLSADEIAAVVKMFQEGAAK